MAEQGYEYEQYAPQESGRLFSSAMFGFNKEEVLEYLDELADENYQHQAAAEQQIADLSQTVMNLQATINDLQQGAYRQGYFADDGSRQAEELEIARAATQQAEGELAELRDQFYRLQQENEWYRDAYQKNDTQIKEMSRQLNDAASGRRPDTGELEKCLNEAQQRLAEKQHEAEEQALQQAELRSQLEKANAELAAARHLPEQLARESIIADANAEAERIRAVAKDERDRLRRQIRTSASGLTESLSNLRAEVSGVENDVTSVLEAVQKAMAEVNSALGRTEQGLSTFSGQVERFPAAMPGIPRPAAQQPLYFQPAKGQAGVVRPSRPTAPESFGTGGFRRLEPPLRDSRARAFRSVPAQMGANRQPTPLDEERIRALAESLVNTLVEMLT